MIKIFETLETKKDTNDTEDDENFVDVGFSITPNCKRFCRRHAIKSDNWGKPTRCSRLRKQRKQLLCVYSGSSGGVVLFFPAFEMKV